jgi:enoyl-CoA hydratase/carnithine racemase
MSEGRIVSQATDSEIAVISVNNPPVNTITAAVRQELSEALDGLGR